MAGAKKTVSPVVEKKPSKQGGRKPAVKQAILVPGKSSEGGEKLRQSSGRKGKAEKVPDTQAQKFHASYEHIISARYQPQKQRPGSAISVQQTSVVDVVKTRRTLKTEHPLLSETPDEWKNIPICVITAVKHIINEVIVGNECLFEY